MSEIRICLETSHSAFPVINLAGNLCGIMSKPVLCVLLRHSHFYNQDRAVDNLEIPSFGGTITSDGLFNNGQLS